MLHSVTNSVWVFVLRFEFGWMVPIHDVTHDSTGPQTPKIWRKKTQQQPTAKDTAMASGLGAEHHGVSAAT